MYSHSFPALPHSVFFYCCCTFYCGKSRKRGRVMEKLEQHSSEGETDHSQGSRRSMDWKYSHISADEEDLIIRLHRLLGDRWTLIAGRLPWRTTEEIERYWRMRCQLGHDTSESSD